MLREENTRSSSITEHDIDFVKRKVINQIVERKGDLFYHDLNFVRRVLNNLSYVAEQEGFTDEEHRIAIYTFYTTVYIFNHLKKTKEGFENYREEFQTSTKELLPSLLNETQLDTSSRQSVLNCMTGMMDIEDQNDRIVWAINDARVLDFTGKKGVERLEQFYKEFIIQDVKISLSQFHKETAFMLGQYNPQTTFAKDHIKPQVDKLILKLEKEQKKTKQRHAIAAKRELEIEQDEYRQLEKNLKSVKGRDARGIQTLFRTTSQNHYTINEMVDRKANIMITVNSIILSIVIGGHFIELTAPLSSLDPAFLALSITNLLSIIFAILAITPNRTQGSYSRDEIRHKQGSLLYFGNYYKLKYEDYEEAMMDKINDSEYMYKALIKDLYFLGQTLAKKNKLIRVSLTIFLSGIIISFSLMLLKSCGTLFWL